MTVRAEIHPNIHLIKAGESACISLREIKKYSRTRHVATAILSDVEFVVRDAGRDKAVKEQVKNVHAFARGTLTGDFDRKITLADMELPGPLMKRFRQVSYHYNVGHFFDVKTKERVDSAKTVIAVGKEYYYLPK